MNYWTDTSDAVHVLILFVLINVDKRRFQMTNLKLRLEIFKAMEIHVVDF